MIINQIFELSMVLDTDRFQKILTMAHRKSDQMRETEEGYIDLLMAPKGITVNTNRQRTLLGALPAR